MRTISGLELMKETVGSFEGEVKRRMSVPFSPIESVANYAWDTVNGVTRKISSLAPTGPETKGVR
jgi:hypothetical protein